MTMRKRAVLPPAGDAAQRVAEDRLQRAAAWLLAMHPVGPAHDHKNPLCPYGGGVVYRFDPPGVLKVFDRLTGELLAESAPGRPDKLARRFVAPKGRL